MGDVAVSTQAAQALRIMYNGIKCIDNRIDAKLEEQQRAIDEGLGVEEEPGAAREECPYHISPQMLWEAKLKKRTLQKGALDFNQSAKEGIKYLQEARLIPDPAAPADIARAFCGSRRDSTRSRSASTWGRTRRRTSRRCSRTCARSTSRTSRC